MFLMKFLRNIILGTLFLLLTATTVQARILFQDDEADDFASPVLLLDFDGGGTENTGVQFGDLPGLVPDPIIFWDIASEDFRFSHDINLQQNELQEVALENLASAPLTPTAGQIYHNTTDGNTYVWNGTQWEDITALNSTSTKVVTVGPGLDYAQINDAVGYLNTLSGGIILLSAGTHDVLTQTNLSNITLIGKGIDRTTIQIAAGGQMDSFDTRFNNLKIDVNAINDDMAIDVQTGSNSLIFDRVEFAIQDSGDSLIDSNGLTAPTVSLRFIKTNQIAESGTILKTQAGSNLDSNSSIFVDGRSGDGALQLDDWDVTIAEAGNVFTTGIITAIPDRSIFVSPNMNLQGAIDSLEAGGIGGLITLLPGTHVINEPLTINDDDIQLVGYGDGSIIRAESFGATGSTIGAIQVGAADGSAPVNGVVIQDLKLEVASNIHGVRVTGGADNRVLNVTVEKISGQAGSGSTADIGIQMLDSSSGILQRGVIQNCRVLGGGGTIYFTDGIHVTSDPSISGVWGFNQGISNVLVQGNFVDYVRETGYVIIGADDSSLFNNRASRMGAAGGGVPYGIYLGNIRNVDMNANVFTGSISNNSIGIGIDSFNTGTLTEDSIFNNNVIDGTSNGGAGFATGFDLGSATSAVLRSSFENNVIKGPSNVSTVAINLEGNSDGNSFSRNDIDGGGNGWDTGINIDSSVSEQNIISENRYANVTNRIADSGSETLIGVSHHRAASDPTANDDANDGYQIGFIWINESTDQAFILVDDTAGAAVWKDVSSTGGAATAKVGQFYDSNGGGGGFNVNSGSIVAIPFNAESFPEDAAYSHDTVTNNSQISINETGLYKVSYSISHENQAGSRKNVRCAIRLNGSTFPSVAGDSYSYSRNTNEEWATNSATAFIDFTAGDYYEIVCQQEGSGGDADLVDAGSGEGASYTLIEKIR